MKFFARPLGLGFIFGAIGILLTVVGVVRGEVPAQPASIAVALALGGGIWFLIAWAVASAARDVESDVAAQAALPFEGDATESSQRDVGVLKQ